MTSLLLSGSGCFNPRPPHGGRHGKTNSAEVTGGFNPRPPHGGRLFATVSWAYAVQVSIHALRTEGDWPR